MNASSSRILVIGAGHLAQRVREHLAAAAVTSPPDAVETADLSGIARAFLLDDDDDINLRLLVTLRARAPQLPVTAAIFNDAVAAHLSGRDGHVRIVNPATIAAPTFVAALDAPIERRRAVAVAAPSSQMPPRAGDRLLVTLGLAFLALVVSATTYFHVAERLSWVDALYFVVVTVATVGYGDINLLNSPASHKLVGIGLIVVSTVFIWLIFSLTVDRIIKQRVELSLGRKRYAMKGHVVVCGLGRMGRPIVDALLARGENVVIVEASVRAPGIDHYRTRASGVYIGDATASRVLQAVAVQDAKAVFALTDADFTNVEIGLNARAMSPDVRVILRLFDPVMAERIKAQFDIHLALSMSAIAARELVSA